MDLDLNDPEWLEYAIRAVDRLSYLLWLVLAVGGVYLGAVGLAS